MVDFSSSHAKRMSSGYGISVFASREFRKSATEFADVANMRT